MKISLTSFLFALSFIFLKSTYAQDFGPSSGGFGLSIDAKGVYGSAQTQDNTTVAERGLYGYGAGLGLSYSMGLLYFGASGEFINWLQRDKASDFGNTNMAGTMKTFSGVFGINFQSFILFGRYHFKSDIELKYQTSGAEDATWSDPEGSYSIGIRYRGMGDYISVEYSTVSYHTSTVNGTSTELLDAEVLTYSAWIVSYGFNF